MGTGQLNDLIDSVIRSDLLLAKILIAVTVVFPGSSDCRVKYSVTRYPTHSDIELKVSLDRSLFNSPEFRECLTTSYMASREMIDENYRAAADSAVNSWECYYRKLNPIPRLIEHSLSIADAAYMELEDYQSIYCLYFDEYMRNLHSSSPDSQLMSLALISMGRAQLFMNNPLTALTILLSAEQFHAKINHFEPWHREMLYDGIIWGLESLNWDTDFREMSFMYLRKISSVWDSYGPSNPHFSSSTNLDLAEAYGYANEPDSAMFHFLFSISEMSDLYYECDSRVIDAIQRFSDWIDRDMGQGMDLLRCFTFVEENLVKIDRCDESRNLLQVADSFALCHDGIFKDSVGYTFALWRLHMANALNGIIEVSDTTIGRYYLDLGISQHTLKLYVGSRDSYSQAAKFFKSTVDKNHPVFGEIHRRTAITYLDEGNIEKAEDEFKKAIKYLPELNWDSLEH